ncbi:MAG TPA: LuxR C-terminal-related transcriptional regulator, partial [Vicinamibacteria bacterium]
AVFAGGGPLAAVEAVCAAVDRPPLDILAGLDALVGQSLVRQWEGAVGEPRFGMLETIREYALERLEQSGEEGATRRAHAAHYLALAEAQPGLRDARWAAWLAALARELDNLRAALAWALERGDGETALRLGGALRPFWSLLGHASEGRRWLEAALAQGDGAPAAVRARALSAAGLLAHGQGDYAAGEARHEASLALWRTLGDRHRIADELDGLAGLAQSQGAHDQARALHEESLALRRALADRSGVRASLAELGALAREQGDHTRATRLLEESLALARDAGEAIGSAVCLVELGWTALYQGAPGRARPLAEEGLAAARALGSLRDVARARMVLGWIALAEGDAEGARLALGEALALHEERGARWGVAYCLEGLAVVAGRRGQAARAARLGGAAEGLRAAIGAPAPPAHRAHYAPYLAAARARLGGAAWAAAWAAGRALSPEQAAALALAPTPMEEPGQTAASASRPAPPPRYPTGLTAREVEVLRLVAEGLTNAQVAARLFLSPRTVDRHLGSIYGKLGVATRTAAATFAIEHGLR